MSRIIERVVNFVASLITLGVFVFSALPSTRELSAPIVAPQLGIETRIAALLLIELAIIYSGRILFRLALRVAPFVDDQVAAFIALLAILILIGWATALDYRFFFPTSASALDFGMIAYVGVSLVISYAWVTAGTPYESSSSESAGTQ